MLPRTLLPRRPSRGPCRRPTPHHPHHHPRPFTRYITIYTCVRLCACECGSSVRARLALSPLTAFTRSPFVFIYFYYFNKHSYFFLPRLFSIPILVPHPWHHANLPSPHPFPHHAIFYTAYRYHAAAVCTTLKVNKITSVVVEGGGGPFSGHGTTSINDFVNIVIRAGHLIRINSNHSVRIGSMMD